MSPTRQLSTEQDESHPINSTSNDVSATTLDGKELNLRVCATCSTRPITRSGDGGGGASYVTEEIATMVNMREKQVRPSLARRVAMAAAMAVTLMEPVRRTPTEPGLYRQGLLHAADPLLERL